jgi:hypothetical protein
MPIIPLSGSAVAHGALIPLGTYTYTSPAGGVGFNLPANSSIYQDLIIVCSLRNEVAGAGLTFYFNGDVGSGNYSSAYINTNAATVSAGRSASQNYIVWYQEPTPYDAPNMFATHTFHLINPHASTTTPYRTVLHKWGNDLNGNGSTGIQVISWIGAATMAAVTVGSTSGNFSTGSTFSIYGVRSVGQ